MTGILIKYFCYGCLEQLSRLLFKKKYKINLMHKTKTILWICIFRSLLLRNIAQNPCIYSLKDQVQLDISVPHVTYSVPQTWATVAFGELGEIISVSLFNTSVPFILYFVGGRRINLEKRKETFWCPYPSNKLTFCQMNVITGQGWAFQSGNQKRTRWHQVILQTSCLIYSTVGDLKRKETVLKWCHLLTEKLYFNTPTVTSRLQLTKYIPALEKKIYHLHSLITLVFAIKDWSCSISCFWKNFCKWL